MIKIQRGLDLPITGEPEQNVYDASSMRTVALIGPDYHGLKPTMAVKEGDLVKKGQLLFTDKKTNGVKYTAPAAGKVIAINRGARRVFESIVIETNGNENIAFSKHDVSSLQSIARESVVNQLVDSGLWTAFRTRPYSKVPAPKTAPASIFVTAMDTNPLSANPSLIIQQHANSFAIGIDLLTKLTDGKVYVCAAPDANITLNNNPSIQLAQFSGVHPAGNAGTHIHFLDPVSLKKTVWTINYQDVIAIGELFTTGELWSTRYVALGGPQVKKPRILKTQLGANLLELTQNELEDGNNRLVSGSVFGGRTANNNFAYLGRYHSQVSAILEGDDRQVLHYLRPGFNYFSTMGIYISRFFKKKKFNFTSTTNGSERAMVPVGTYETIMPLDILPTQLLRSLIVGDTDMAQKLGCLELDEEDLALCTYVCPGKYEYGPILRDNLTRIEIEG